LSLLDYNSDNLEAVSTEFKSAGFSVNAYTVDISVRVQVEDAVRSAESVKPIDVLINNAGIAEEIPFLQMDEKQWSKVLNINLTGMFTLSQVVCREMVKRRKGVVVNMSSKN